MAIIPASMDNVELPHEVICGFEENADLVGAINILARGRRVAACGETARSGRSVKQEPA